VGNVILKQHIQKQHTEKKTDKKLSMTRCDIHHSSAV